MPASAPFDRYADRYDRWFERHRVAYVSELLAVRTLLPVGACGLEIGVGSGRFAAPLGIAYGIDPSMEMLERARDRGISVVAGMAEALPFANSTFAAAAIITTICFVDDPHAMMREARRVLKPDGIVLIGFIDPASALGRGYLDRRVESVFYENARFFTPGEVAELLSASGFTSSTWVQTLSSTLAEHHEIEAASPGYGHGAFVVVRARCSGR